MINIDDIKKTIKPKSRYEFQIERIKNKNLSSVEIEKTIRNCSLNIDSSKNSFVIYGEPQSGKTEMMICLAAKLLDMNFKIIIILLNDNLELLEQNITRFTQSNISPAPKKFSEILDPEVTIGENEWLIFCKKNSGDLQQLIDKVGNKPNKVIIDDEADYASPNAKVNKGDKTRINELVEKLIRSDGVYIGVTATPARLDLNNTFKNNTQDWVDFRPHDKYHGQEVFFHIDLDKPRSYNLELLPETDDSPKYLRKAFFNFIVGVSYLNTEEEGREDNYSMLVHTSGKTADHKNDLSIIQKLFDALYTETHSNYKKYWEEIAKIAENKHQDSALKVMQYAIQNINRHRIVLMNSDSDRKDVNFKVATSPLCPFTVAIGGNIISRGVTFENLLSMFFTRDVKHKMQQDTYIQRARMFGTRDGYLEHFELHIPEELYMNWHQCFVFHKLAIESIRSGNGAPTWVGDSKITPVAAASIDKINVNFDSGEMSFNIFNYSQVIEEIESSKKLSSLQKLKELKRILGEDCMPSHIIEFIEFGGQYQENSVILHPASTMMNYNSGGVNYENVSRDKGLLAPALNKVHFPENTVHHLKIFYNDKNQARVFYKYKGSVKFFRNVKNIKND